jgi:small redox-active disulfide protein 2
MGLFGKKIVSVKCGCGCENVKDAPSGGEHAAQTEGATVKILGGGCAKCNQLEAATKAALERLGMNTAMDHVKDYAQIAAYGVMSTPALVVDGKVVSFGRVLTTEEVAQILQKVRGV